MIPSVAAPVPSAAASSTTDLGNGGASVGSRADIAPPTPVKARLISVSDLKLVLPDDLSRL